MGQIEDNIGILYQALGEQVGLLLQAEDPAKSREALYRARVKAGDPDLARLQIRLVELDGGNLVIVKGERVPAPKWEPPKPLGIAQGKASDLDL